MEEKASQEAVAKLQIVTTNLGSVSEKPSKRPSILVKRTTVRFDDDDEGSYYPFIYYTYCILFIIY